MSFTTNTIEQPLACALIGPGNFGRGLARALLEDKRVALAGVLGATPAESATGATTLGGRPFAALDELLQADDVRAVLIATPSSTHAHLAVACARAGKHVFVEKPMALSVVECDSMIAAAHQRGVALMVGQVQRLVPLLADVRQLVQNDIVGQPVSVQMHRHDMLRRQARSWLQRRELVGGVLHQSSVHEIDWLRSTFGEVTEVFARPGATIIQTGLDFPDAIELSVRFASGCVCALSHNMSSFAQGHGGTIHGTTGGIAFDLRAGTLRWQNASGASEHVQRDDYTIGAGHAIATRAELRAFIDACVGLAPPLIPGAEGRANIEVIQAALISIAEQRPVTLPLPADQLARRPYL
ncbi:MAG: Gfo/Idh/MocA family oxidoreductase [Chloroflexales bacterium]|nr:Gfo/Idh/MocA family oxidoreductase [Chloroflexales bacterium]